ncbi:MAG: tRNA N6-adenosine threonylcarbamoyltransferase [Calditrichaeota bacterium]|nr:tRNA N6-adenosine threonylcarbamoyltransferase [Calditrichota bacterium]
MSRLLAIDTSGRETIWTGVDSGDPVDPVTVEPGRRHDALLADGVNRWLDEHGRRRNLDAIAVVTGPGGFTGLRVGIAFASGLAAALAFDLVPVSVEEVLGASVDEGLVWALTRAGRDQMRGRVVRGGDEPELLGEPAVFDPRAQIPAPAGEQPLLPLGEGYELHHDAIDRALGSRLLRRVRLHPPAVALALAADHAFNAGRFVTPLEIDVEYGADFRPTPKPGPR